MSASASKRVLLAVMPFLPLHRPALGVSQLKSECEARGLTCDVAYFTFDYAALIGLADYQRIDGQLPTQDLCGEWLFAEAAFGRAAPAPEVYQRTVLDEAPAGFYDDAFLERLHEIRQWSPAFVGRCADAVDLDDYDIVGVTSTFQQNAASIALVRELKRRRPDVLTVFGGGNADGVMGPAWLRCVSELDVVVSGEADLVLPDLVERVRAGRGLDGLPGVHTRTAASAPVASRPVLDLDALHQPAFEDFFAALTAFPQSDGIRPELSVETSRGCWWGQRHHCTFCGLNGTGIGYRSKSPQRAYAELCELSDHWGVDRFFASDNIINPSYFDTVFRWIPEEGRRLDVQYEMKSSLRRHQLRALGAAGTTWFQPGVESLSSHVLELMDKGVTAIQNVQALKWGREMGLTITWNILCGFPGETAADYVTMLETMRRLTHLQPPASFAMFRVDRFSPMYDQAAAHGLTNVRPGRAYALCFPFPDDELRQIAYFFECDRPRDPAAILAANEAWQFCVDLWSPRHGTGTLTARVADHLVLLEDSRPGWPARRAVLTGLERAVLLAADCVQTPAGVQQTVDQRALPGEQPVAVQDVQRVLDHLVTEGWVLREGDDYLSLPLFVGCRDDELGPVHQASPPRRRQLTLVGHS